MLRQKEFGVLSGSEYFFGTLAMQKQALFYSVHMCGHYYCDKRYRIDRQGLDCLMLMLVENGTMELQFHEKTITAHSGDILLFDGNDYHAYHTPEYVEFYWMHFSGVNSLELYQHLTRENGGVLTLPKSTPKLPHRFAHWFANLPIISWSMKPNTRGCCTAPYVISQRAPAQNITS